MGFLGQGFSNCGSHKATWRQLNDTTHTHNHTHTVPRAGRYTKINYELRYCSVRLSHRKGRDFKTYVACFEARTRTSCNNRGSQSNCSLLKCSVRIINEKQLSHFTALCSAWDCIHRKIQMLRKLYQVGCLLISIVCLNSALYLSERCKEFVVFVPSYAFHMYGLSRAQKRG